MAQAQTRHHTHPAFAVEACHLRKEFPRRRRGSGFRRGSWRGFRPGFWRRAPADKVIAVSDVSFGVEPGEIFGLLGPNGAGKTTTIRMLCTLLEPTAGTATVNGFDTVRDPLMVRRSLGTVLTGERSVYWKLTGRENLEYFAAMYGLSRREQRQPAAAVLKRLALEDKADQLVETYSSGMKQRIALGKALLADQPILLLDEPTIGLDPAAARSIRSLVRELREDGRTILLTTHYMEEADQLCDRVAIIDEGSIIACDKPRHLKDSIGEGRSLLLEVSDWTEAVDLSVKAVRGATGAIARHLEEREIWQVSVLLDNGSSALADIISILSLAGVRIHAERRVSAAHDLCHRRGPQGSAHAGGAWGPAGRPHGADRLRIRPDRIGRAGIRPHGSPGAAAWDVGALLTC